MQKKKVIGSLNEFIEFVEERRSLVLRSFFRGQENHTWKLIPSFYRLKLKVYDNSKKDVLPNYKFVEETMLTSFMQRGAPMLKNYDIQNSLDLMVVAQHHGLPTRLLDWTENPLYALYFAVENTDAKVDGCVYEYLPVKFDTYNYIAETQNFESATDYWFVSPRHINERVRAQGGHFTLHPLSKKLIVKSFDSLLVENGETQFDKIIIPKGKKKLIRKELEKLNINRFTIYPDLDGLAEKIKWELNNLPLLIKGKRLIASK